MTIRLLATYGPFSPNTIVTLASGTETTLVAGGNATTDLSGGVPYNYQLPQNTRQNGIAYAPDGTPLGYSDSAGTVLAPFPGISVPGAPTGLALTPIAGGLVAAFTAPAISGGTAITGYELTLSTGQVQVGATTTITINAPATAITATVKAINGYGKSAASSASASATPTAYVAPTYPGAPTGLTLTRGDGKVTATWTAAATNGSAIRNTVVTLSNGAVGVAQGSATTIDITTPNGQAVTATARANNSEGPGPVSTVSNSVTPAPIAIITLTQSQSPYTIQASDDGNVLLVQSTADFTINAPVLNTGFTVNVQQAAGYIYPVIIAESSTTGVNTNGLPIKSDSTHAEGLGSNMVRGPGKVATLTYTSSSAFTLSGDVGKMQQVCDRTGYPNSTNSTIRQAMGRTFHAVNGGKVGGNLVRMLIGYTNTYGWGESVIAGDMTVGCALEYPIGASTTPVQGLSGGSATATLVGGTKNTVFFEVVPTSPIPFNSTWEEVAIRTYFTGASGTGICYGNGKRRDEYYEYGTATSPSIDRTMTLFSAFPANPVSLQGSNPNSQQCIRPCLILGVTDTGATFYMGTSRDTPSNGDVPATRYAGDIERIWGRQGCFGNFAASSEGMGTSWTSNPQNSALRRSWLKYFGNVVNGHGVNDLSAGITQLEARYTALMAIAEFKGRRQYVNTIAPTLIATTDYLTTLAGQSQSNATLETNRVAVNAAIRAGTISGITGYAELADIYESARDSGLLKVHARARTLTDVTITAGTNVLNSPLGAFTSADDGLYARVPMGSSGAYQMPVLTYVSATQMTMKAYGSFLALNATTAVIAGQNVYIGADDTYTDGTGTTSGLYANHGSYRAGALVEAQSSAPTIPAIGPVN